MLCHKKFVCIFLPSIILFFAATTVASDKPTAEQQKAAEEHSSQNFSGKQDLEWEKVQTKLGALKGKLDSQENIVKALLSEKAALAGETQQEKLKTLKEEHNRYKTMLEEYMKLNDEFLTKFPEKGIKELRIYNRQKKKTLGQFNKEILLQEKVDGLHNKILQQYPNAAKKHSPKKSAVEKKMPPKDSSVKKESHDENADVTESILFSK